ncbi:hypothetical protein WJX74_001592 [Apatococcus lobatus]|uniref:Uncharacterized protein n=1 Tax=Apatococcus lobatus TaxID=904363 RepID=A0AAW1R088_9CHLO
MSGEAPSKLLLRSLQKFYEEQANFDTLHLLLDKRRGKAADMPSLRILEHLVTSFSLQKGFDFRLPHTDVPMHLHDAYQAELLRHGKVLFDVFAREDKHNTAKHLIESPDGDGRTLETTAKQMNFIRWAIINRVIDYARDNLPAIRDHLPRQCRTRAEDGGPQKKRQRNSYTCPSRLHNGCFKLSFTLPSQD